MRITSTSLPTLNRYWSLKVALPPKSKVPNRTLPPYPTPCSKSTVMLQTIPLIAGAVVESHQLTTDHQTNLRPNSSKSHPIDHANL